MEYTRTRRGERGGGWAAMGPTAGRGEGGRPAGPHARGGGGLGRKGEEGGGR
jgi:hypothetical protein